MVSRDHPASITQRAKTQLIHFPGTIDHFPNGKFNPGWDSGGSKRFKYWIETRVCVCPVVKTTLLLQTFYDPKKCAQRHDECRARNSQTISFVFHSPLTPKTSRTMCMNCHCATQTFDSSSSKTPNNTKRWKGRWKWWMTWVQEYRGVRVTGLSSTGTKGYVSIPNLYNQA